MMVATLMKVALIHPATVVVSGDEMAAARLLAHDQVASQVGCTLVSLSEEMARSKNMSAAPHEASGLAKGSTGEKLAAETRRHGSVKANPIELQEDFGRAIRAKRRGPSRRNAVKPIEEGGTKENIPRTTVGLRTVAVVHRIEAALQVHRVTPSAVAVDEAAEGVGDEGGDATMRLSVNVIPI
mmetsp:Transcript_561/g.1351  ORF Transcript_561/g.1351 Transcript_561/m.1351 type:complete len:183 (-) Transcript_561:108-656(-)